jgi:hypothetical protein
MPTPSRWLRHSLQLILAFFILVGFDGTCNAQQLIEVEIEVVGPWSIAPDPRPSTGPPRLLLIAPTTLTTGHKVDVYSGGDAYKNNKKDVTAGSYGLDFSFDPRNCKGNPHPNLLPLMDVKVTSAGIIDAIMNPNQRYAISLPKPCSFDTYLDARSIVSSSAITDPSGEQRYTTWLKFHYTVSTSISSVVFSGNSDANGMNPLPQPIPFTNNASIPPKSEAITIVLYDETDPEDYDCDSYSAMFFDASVVGLWKQPGKFRLFPELDGGHNQSGTYNFTCNQVPQKTAMTTHAPSRPLFREQIASIRAALRSSDIKEINAGVDRLKKDIAQVWGTRTPLAIGNDLAAIERIEDFLQKDKANKFQAINADEYLSLTEHILTAGRTDCHSMQINVNNAVH